jgi:hypothetical protein
MFVLLLGIQVQAQEVQERLNEAQSSYSSGDLENARFALQQALQGINQAIGKDILGLLPDNLGGMDKVDTDDNVTGVNIGFAGLFVNRSYKGENKDAAIQIMSDSPMIAGINAMLAMPSFINSDPNQKRIKIENYKALLTKSTNTGGVVSYNIQMPFGSSMFTFTSNGINEENEVTTLLKSIPVEKIIKTAE